MPHFTTPAGLTDLLPWTGAMFCLTFGVLLKALMTRSTDYRPRYHITQSTRYRLVIVALTVWLVAVVPLLVQYSPSQVLTALAEFRNVDVTYGWALTVSVLLQAVVPLCVVLVLIWIYAHPSPLAKRIYGNLYLLTFGVRIGYPMFVVC